MTPNELFKAGKLSEAIDAQLKEVKSRPADHGQRLFLFELLAFAGDLDRAQRQIEAVNYNEMELDAAVLTYRRLLDSERARRRLFSESLIPRFFGPQPEHVQIRLEAVNRIRENRLQEAAELLNKAAGLVPEIKGEINGKAFASLRDCDDLFGGVLEVMAQGAYFWVPIEQVDTISVVSPKTPRDLIWLSARLDMTESAGNVHLPVLYAGSHQHPDDQVKLGRMTDWKASEAGPVLGVGARTFLVDEDATGILDWRQLEITH